MKGVETMGWVSYHVDTDIKNGKLFFDRKKECDEVLNRGIGKEHKILKICYGWKYILCCGADTEIRQGLRDMGSDFFDLI